MSNLSQAEPVGNTKTTGQLYRWCFTLPYEECTASQLSQLLKGFCKEFYYQAESGKETNYKHWQGCFSLILKERFSTVKNHFPCSIHIEGCKHWWKSVSYCNKSETRIEGPYDHTSKFINLPTELLDWQKMAKNTLLEDKSDRTIHWFVDEKGAKGKTTFCKYMAIKHGAIVLNNAKTADLAYAIDNPEIVLFNLTRTNEGHINYGALESIKDGLIFSSKYESGMKIFNSPVVAVFANFEPDYESMSKDRWNVIKL